MTNRSAGAGRPKWKMPKAAHRQVYGLTDAQRRWSTFKVRLVLRAKWPAKAAKNYFYAELLRRRKAVANV